MSLGLNLTGGARSGNQPGSPQITPRSGPAVEDLNTPEDAKRLLQTAEVVENVTGGDSPPFLQLLLSTPSGSGPRLLAQSVTNRTPTLQPGSEGVDASSNHTTPRRLPREGTPQPEENLDVVHEPTGPGFSQPSLQEGPGETSSDAAQPPADAQPTTQPHKSDLPEKVSGSSTPVGLPSGEDDTVVVQPPTTTSGESRDSPKPAGTPPHDAPPVVPPLPLDEAAFTETQVQEEQAPQEDNAIGGICANDTSIKNLDDLLTQCDQFCYALGLEESELRILTRDSLRLASSTDVANATRIRMNAASAIRMLRRFEKPSEHSSPIATEDLRLNDTAISDFGRFIARGNKWLDQGPQNREELPFGASREIRRLLRRFSTIESLGSVWHEAREQEIQKIWNIHCPTLISGILILTAVSVVVLAVCYDKDFGLQ